MQQRLEFLDGLRGWAALIVVFLHAFVGVLPPVEDAGAYIRTWWPFTGRFSVDVFFLISGFALSIAFIRKQNRQTLVRMATGRYFRLFIPIFVVCILVSLSMNTGLFPDPTERPLRKATKFAFDPTLQHLLKFSFFDVFFNYSPKETYAGPLWTMSIEFYGSMIVAATLFVFGRPRKFWPVFFLIAAALLYYKSFYFLFFVGMICCDYYQDLSHKRLRFLAPVLLIVGAAIPVLFRPNTYAMLCGTSIFFVGVVMSSRAKFVMETKFSKWLGKISFPLYLVHVPILYIVGMPLYMAYPDNIAMRIFIGFVAIFAGVLASIALVPVNTFAMHISRYVGNKFVRLLYRKP